MIKVAFLGCDSTHTEAFGKQINLAGGLYFGRAEVVSIWGEDPLQAKTKAEALKIPLVADSIEEALEGVDLAMVIGRFGESHFAPARKALERGIPTFVDKPFTIKLSEAKDLANLSREKNTPLFSCSPLRFAKEIKDLSNQFSEATFVSVSAPANCTDLGPDPRFKSVFFYGIHAVEMLLQICGSEVQAVKVVPGKSALDVQVEFEKTTAGLRFLYDADEFYEVNLYTQQKQIHVSLALDGSYYPNLLSHLFEEFLRGKPTIPLESTIQAISILEMAESISR